jgi:hypothetical protein
VTLTATADLPELSLTGDCVLSGCTDRVTGQVMGVEPPMLVCAFHTPSVERAADYTVRPIPVLTLTELNRRESTP